MAEVLVMVKLVTVTQLAGLVGASRCGDSYRLKAAQATRRPAWA